MGNAVLLDPDGTSTVINESDVSTSDVLEALHNQQPLVAAMVRWTRNTQPMQADYMSNDGGVAMKRAGGLFERDRFVTPQKTFDQIRLAQSAVSDDVVDGFLETTESLAFSSMSFYADDEDEEDVWNQIAADLDLDSRLREMWRETATASQCYLALWWGRKSYKVRGKTDKGNERRRQFPNLQVPVSISFIDPLKVVPVGQLLFGQEKLAYIATNDEAENFTAVLADPGLAVLDPIVATLVTGRYTPSRAEITELANYGVTDTRNLFLLNPAYVFRHTATRPSYRRFAEVRMKSIFELLDQKQQLRQMDRAHLVGGTNFIVLIKKGSDKFPAQQAEIDSLQANVRTVAQVPVIVGDHRLSVEIITPTLDNTLAPERYNTVNSAITARLYGMFLLGNKSAGGSSDDSVKLTRVVAAGMESRRKMMARSLAANIWRRTVAMNEQFTSMPKLRYQPKRIALNFDNAWASFLLDIRDTGDLSRDTILTEFDFSQEDEARRREREAEHYDDVFQTTVPGAPAPTSPAPAKPGSAANKKAGRRGGGTRRGGGSAPGSGQGQPPRKPRKLSDSKVTPADEESHELAEEEDGEHGTD